MSAFWVKQTSAERCEMSAFGTKRTSAFHRLTPSGILIRASTMLKPCLFLGENNLKARVYHLFSGAVLISVPIQGRTMRLFGLFLGLLIASPVHARWKPQYASSPYATWYESQRGCGGGKCCHEADAEPYYGSWTFNADGSVTLDNGARIASCSVIRGPNPTGHAVWWHKDRVSYCFAPGSDF
jgi:hypothetical protein